MKKIKAIGASLLLVGAIMGSSLPAFADTVCTRNVIIGDVNHDHVVDSLDTYVLRSNILYSTPEFNFIQQIAGNVNADDSINQEDIDVLNDYLLENITSLPAGSNYTVILGDVDGDSYVTQDDKDLLQDYLLNNAVLCVKRRASADVNGDNVVDALDYSLMTQYLNGTILNFPACETNIVR